VRELVISYLSPRFYTPSVLADDARTALRCGGGEVASSVRELVVSNEMLFYDVFYAEAAGGTDHILSDYSGYCQGLGLETAKSIDPVPLVNGTRPRTRPRSSRRAAWANWDLQYFGAHLLRSSGRRSYSGESHVYDGLQ
jgi:hypothetical protein